MGTSASASNAMAGLKNDTATHMLRSVLGNTPSACSSTKLAELSNPEIPSSAAEKPKNSASNSPPSVRSAKVGRERVDAVRSTKPTPTTSRTVSDDQMGDER